MERDEQPPERKSLTLHVLRDLAILLAISLVWKEPLLAFTHDFKDFFNQLHLHPSQTWMATILWSEAGRMRHYIEKSLAFGQKKSSNYAQRWANAVITIMWSRFDAEERKLFDAETDPERRAVINQRDALSTLTGRNEMRCAAAHVYTDDTIGLVVGFERFVRLITCWYQVESMLNIRMAEPLKYHAGTSVEWCGNRILATIGADVIPPAKQQRALAGLTKLQANRMTVEEADETLSGTSS